MKKFSEQVTYSVSAEEVRRAQTEKGYVDFLAERFASELNATVRQKSSRTEGDTTTLSATVTVPVSGVPDIAKRFLGSSIDVTVTERWKDALTGDFEVTTEPRKLTLASDFALRDTAGGCVRTYDGSFTVHVPLIGGTIETQALSYIAAVLRIEKRAVEAYLAREN